MKRTLLTILLVVVALTTFAQEKRRFFCEIKGQEKELSAGLKIVFDFGENPVYSIWGDLKGKQKLVDEAGNEITFNSMVDAANYMTGKGWTFQQAYSSAYGGNALVHWIFYKDATSQEEAGAGILTKGNYKKQQK